MSKSAILPIAGALFCAALIAGCSSSQAERRAANPPQPVLEGKTLYLNGQVEVAARLSPFGMHAGPPRGEAGEQKGRGEGERPRRRRETRSEDGAGSGVNIDMMPESEHPDESDNEGATLLPGPHWNGGIARQSLVITVRNLGKDPIPVTVEDVTSPIGNFVAFPESFTLAPGAEQALEPMRAAYPSAIEQLDVNVRIGSGDKHEEHSVRLDMVGPQPRE